MKDEALRLALEALSEAHYVVEHRQDVKKREQAITAIKEALANEALDKMAENARELGLEYEPEQEPVTWRNAAIRVGEDLCSVGPFRYYDMTAEQWLDWALSVVTVHAPPPQRTWVGLDDEDYIKAYELCDFDKDAAFEFFETKLKEKNT
jgi:hypothetical protein